MGDATRRAQAGISARRADDHGRSYADIVRQNMFTFLNIVLVVIGVVLISMHLWRDAFIATGLALLNGVVGMLQEIRAKRRLDSIALLYRVKARVIRDGSEIALDPFEIVEGDLLVLGPGDQVLVDGVVATGKLECDESLLTGESDPVQKVSGDPIYSGSYCVTGTGRFIAERVGSASLAQTIAAGARSYRMELTPLQRNVNTIIRLLLAIAGFYLAISLMGAAIWEYSPQRTALTSAVIIGIVPTGLFLMITVTYSLAAVRLANHDALIQQNNAVESLSNVDIFCMDKTGTLTANRIKLDAIRPIEGNETDIRNLLGTFAHSVSASNATSDAIASACPGSATDLADEVVFSSQRKWSAIAVGGDWTGVMALGAPEMLAPHFAHGTGGSAPEDWTNAGLRVLVFATTEGSHLLHDDRDEVCLPADLRPIAWIAFSDELRPQSRETLEGFQQAGITLKIISGDNADTVAALAKQAGLDPNASLISGPELAGLDDAAFAQAAEEHTVFGRIAPDQKERIIGSLRDRGHYVAMTGDGVNDVLSLKRANLGIAM
ncbi:MAG TPA: HAD-IC family P-type ATPase, partial [Thermomicrobiales bacterium]|nr:HAD-IC family P-type ATPase [Thermomicrobiales bacterium]